MTKAKHSQYPPAWASLPDQHHRCIKALVQLFTRKLRWPTLPELAKHLGRSVSSIENSLDVLKRAKVLTVESYGRGVPPIYHVKGFEVEMRPTFTPEGGWDDELGTKEVRQLQH